MGPTIHITAIYRICVRGHPDASWADRLGGMKITESRGSDGELETVLAGRLADQAASQHALRTTLAGGAC